jgi:hypothetical protein
LKELGGRLFGRHLRPSVYMSFRAIMLMLAASLCSLGADPALAQIKTVYLLPMGNGLDQFLATEVAKAGSMQVVTDPALADAVFTDKLGMRFEEAFAELYPPPPPPPAPKDEKAEKSGKTDDEKEKAASVSPLADLPDLPQRTSSFSRGRGNVFLVDRKSRLVLWSDYGRPKSSRPDDMNRLAQNLVKRLQEQLKLLQQPPR